MTHQINDAGLELVKHFEGCRLQAYLDVAGIPTIGYGHIKGVHLGMTCDQAQAEAWLEEDLIEAENGVTASAKEPNENEFAAMVVFTFNVGTANFRSSSVCRLFNAGDRQGAARAFLLWDKAHVKGIVTVLPGLQQRRSAESQLFLTPVGDAIVGAEVVVPEESGVSAIAPPKPPTNNAVPIATAAATAVGGAREAVDKVAGVRESLEWAGLDAQMILWGMAIIVIGAVGFAIYSHFKFHRNQ